MKKFFPLSIMMYMTILCLSCKKGDKGDLGPTGNADVTVYSFGSKSFSQAVDYELPIPTGKLDSSLVLAYYNPSNEDASAWFSVPGTGSSNNYNTRSFFYAKNNSKTTTTFSVRLQQTNGSGPYNTSVTFRKFRIIVAPASNFVQVNSTGAKKSVDYSDYHAVLKHYNLSE